MEAKKLNLNKPLLSVRVNRNTRSKTPKPLRQLSLPSQKPDWELTEVTKPAAIPFVWEQTPGRPKNGSNLLSVSQEKPSVTSGVPPGMKLQTIKCVSGEQIIDRTVSRSTIEASPLNDNVKDINVSKDSGSSSEDDAYSDALDTLSATGSFSWNCSVTGLSGYDGPCVKSSRDFTADPQTRDLMMTRFLPAARAMVIETPQYVVPRKQPVVSERPTHVKKIVSGELRPLLERYGANAASYSSQCRGGDASDDEDAEYSNRGRKFVKSCGLLPRLCVKNSLLLLDNTVSVKKSRAQSPISSSREVRRMARTVHSGPLPQTHHEKNDWNDIYWKNIQSGAQSQEPIKKKLTSRVSDHFHLSNDSHIAEGISPHRRSRGGGISPYRNEKPRSPFHDGARFLGIPNEKKNNETNMLGSIIKASDKFQDVSSDPICKQGSGSLSHLFEKTLYVDSVNNADVPALDLIKKNTKVTLAESRNMRELYTPIPSIQGVKKVKTKATRSMESDLHFAARIFNSKGQIDSAEGLKVDQDLECLLIHPKQNCAKKNENTIKVDDKGNPSVGSVDSPRPPPLPKSPSESWLWLTVPSFSLPNPFSQVQSKKQGQKTSTTGPKWETIVKISHEHHDHLRYSEELTSHVPNHFIKS